MSALRAARSDPSPLLGRASELARLTELVEADRPVVVVGEAGVGKTTLARAAIAQAGRAGHEGGGFAMLAWTPYLALERAIGRSLAGGDATYAADAVVRSVGAGVLLLDDLQWVDPDSRAVLGHLAGRLGLVVCVRRGDPATSEALAALPDGTTRLDLEPIDPASAAELALRIDPTMTAAEARRLAGRTGGNPLLITELARGGDAALTLAAAVRRRLAPLSDDARAAMTLLALAARPIAPDVLGPGAGELVAAGLAGVDAAGSLRPRHDLIATAAVEALDEDARADAHRRLAERSSDPGQRARHLAAAGERDLARLLALEAADGAATLGERAAHLELAAFCADGPAGLELRVQAVDALVEALESDRARALLGDLAGSPLPAVALAESRVLRLQYEPVAAREALERARAGLAMPGGPSDLEVLVAIEDARLSVVELDRVSGPSRGHRAVELAERHGLHRAAARGALGATRLLATDLGGTDDLAAGMDEALALGDVSLGLAIGSQLAFALLRAGRHADGAKLVRRLAVEAHRARLGAWQVQMAFWASGYAWHSGDFVAATTAWSAFDVEPAETGADWYEVQALGDLGRLDEARIRADRALELAKPGEYDLGEALWLAADVAAHAGRWRDAIGYVKRHAREIPAAHHRVFVELPGAWAAYELGAAPSWPRHEGDMPIIAGGPIELEALRSLAEGRPGAAVPLFEDAAGAWAGRHARGELRSLWGMAEGLRLAGRVADARARLLALEERLEGHGHLPLLGRTRRSLRQVGVRRSAPRAPRGDSFLTARERQILEMSGRGHRDGEIATQLGISRWAVVRAVESAAAKLGAATRAEAVARLTPA